MTDNQFQIIMDMLNQQLAVLNRIADALETEQAAPGYVQDLQDFANFDWSSIGANVNQADRDGVAVVTWRGHRYVRRSASNKFNPAIWFSRAVGKDDSGENRYERLITFKELAEAEPLPDKVRSQHYNRR